MSRYRIACLTSHPIQYQAPLFRYLANANDLELRVFFLSDFSLREYLDPGFGNAIKWDVPLLDGYECQFLPAIGRTDRVSFWRPLARGIGRAIREGQYDAVWVNGYAHQAALRMMLAARLAAVPVLFRGESHELSSSAGPVRRFAKRRLLPRLFGTIDGFLAIGSLNAAYYRNHGVSPQKIFAVPYAVDNDFFRARCLEASRTRESFRRELGLDAARPVILYASKLTRRKRPMDLLAAYKLLSPDGYKEPLPYLIFVGDGEERARLTAEVDRLSWRSIKIVGFRNQTQLPRFYDLCDLFVLPSEREPWGLVVNEVMNAARPVIVTHEVGAGADLVQDGVTGYRVSVGEVSELARRLVELISDPTRAQAMGKEAAVRVSNCSFEADKYGIVCAIEGVRMRLQEARRR